VLCQTREPPCIPIFHAKTYILTPVGRPIVSGCDGPIEKLSSFVDKLVQPIAHQQKSYLKDTTHFINFLEKTKVPENTILVLCFNGRCKYTTRGGNKHSMQRIQIKHSTEKNLLSLHDYSKERSNLS